VTVTAPPRPPATGDLVDWGDPEALIAEARQRARRRRRRYAAAVAVLALLATSVMVVSAARSPRKASRLSLPGHCQFLPTQTIQPASSPSTGRFTVAGLSCTAASSHVGNDRATPHRQRLDLVRSGAIEPAALIFVAPSLAQKLPADTGPQVQAVRGFPIRGMPLEPG
jgi:hypothetical protein